MAPGVVYALISAALFGLSMPAAKGFVGAVHPFVLAGLLYCGAGIGVAAIRFAGGSYLPAAESGRAAWNKRDLGWLGASILCGGVAGPLLLMVGLALTDASAASLLLTLESGATALLAWFIFGEHFSGRTAAGMVCIAAGAIVLAWLGTPDWGGLLGPLMVAGASLAWALDNNLTRRVSLSDPLWIVQWKGLIAGPVNLMLGIAAGGDLPGPATVAAASLVGFVGYGVSLVFFVLGLRNLGAARTGAYFATAPFIGAVAAVIALHEPLTLQLCAAGGLLALGVWLHVTEHHDHEHDHEALAHSHSHVHDEHHRHAHRPGDPSGEPHTHWHEHGPLRHAHPHVPDMHHRHDHAA